MFTVFDLVVGVTALTVLFSVLPEGIYEQGTTLEKVMRSVAIPFAVLGLTGGNIGHRARVDIYSTFKRLEFVGIAAISVYQWTQSLGQAWESVLSVLFFCCLRVSFDFYAMYVAWSSSVKLRSGESLEVEDLSAKPTAELQDLSSGGYVKVVVES